MVGAYLVFDVPAEMLAQEPRERSVVGIEPQTRGRSPRRTGSSSTCPIWPSWRKREHRYQRMMARRQGPCKKSGRRASKRYLRARTLHQRVTQRIAHTRRNWSHQTSRNIADRHTLAVVEDLNIEGMTASAKGTAENPGAQRGAEKRAEQGDTGKWLGHPAPAPGLQDAGGGFEGSGPVHQSEMLECDYIDRKNRKTQASFACRSCGHRITRTSTPRTT